MKLVGSVKIPLLGNAPMTGTISPVDGSVVAEVVPDFTIPQPILDLLNQYGAVVGKVLLADLPAVLWFKTKTWADVLKDVMVAVGL